MKDIINNLGYTNFIIIVVVIVIILILLIVLAVLENKKGKKKYDEEIEKINKNINENQKINKNIDKIEKTNIDVNENIKEKQTKPVIIKKDIKQPETDIVKKVDLEKTIEPIRIINDNTEKNRTKETPIEITEVLTMDEVKKPKKPQSIFSSFEERKKIEDEITIITNKNRITAPKTNNNISKKKENTVAYDEHETTPEEAKKKLQEVTQKLVTENKDNLEGPTYFEQEQEESSIISYDELKKVSKNVDTLNDKLLEDEGNEPITIDELYQKHLDEQDQENIDDTKAVANPVFDDKTIWEPKDFHNSELISPVFGIWKSEIKQATDYTKEDFDKTIEMDELEVEIRKTEEFLKELKDLKNKLD